MPPAKLSAKDDKADGSKAATGSAKMRRNASQPGSAQGREPAPAPTSAPSQPVPEAPAPALNWSTFERDVLHAYRREHKLNTPASFSSTFHNCVLSSPRGIGKYSPTMLRRGAAKRQVKDQLALATRKHFNAVGIQENDVIVDFICKLRNDKAVPLLAAASHDAPLVE
ncbi:hypothetical protein VHEMI03656 [[Torrubiella] hemipterigena]|uniref:Histone deacetylase complex subunit SAP30 Sin3 binding domain-containing protein n=1 Tax=[Torrubiella] hemipterigena TaxID=1531966 RepID=A0A0A1SZ69_9HYPO|nr:hypothetical protein VHEMI03656 [[Torrubiella] hemipterigena]